MNTTALLHQPQRLENESMKAYRVRRDESKLHAKQVLRGSLVILSEHMRFARAKHNRKRFIQERGIRQFKRLMRRL